MKRSRCVIAVFLACIVLLNICLGPVLAATATNTSFVLIDKISPGEEQRTYYFVAAATNIEKRPETIKQTITIGEKLLKKPEWNNKNDLLIASHLIHLYVLDGQIDKGEQLYWQIMDYGVRHGISDYASFPSGNGQYVGTLLVLASFSLTSKYIETKQWEKAGKIILNVAYNQTLLLMCLSMVINQGNQVPDLGNLVKFIDNKLILDIGNTLGPEDRLLLTIMKAQLLYYLGQRKTADEIFDGLDWELCFAVINQSWEKPIGNMLLVCTIRLFDYYEELPDFDRMERLMVSANAALDQVPLEYLHSFIYRLITFNIRAGNFDGAESLLPEYKKALENSRLSEYEKNEAFGVCLLDFYFYSGRLKEAQPILSHRFEENKSRLGSAHEDTANSFYVLLSVSTDLKDANRVLELLAWYEKNETKDVPLTLSRAYLLIGEPEKSRKFLLKAKEDFENNQETYWEYPEPLLMMAETFYTLGDKEEAKRWVQESIESINVYGLQYTMPPREKAMFSLQYKKAYSLYIKLLNETASVEKGFLFLNTIKGQQLNEIFVQNALENDQVLTPQQFSQISKLKANLAYLEVQAVSKTDQYEKEVWEVDKRNAYRQLAEYRKTLVNENPAYGRRMFVTPTPSKVIIDALDKGEVLIDFWLGKEPESSYAYILKKNMELIAIPIHYDEKVQSSLEAFRLLLSYPPNQRQQFIECWKLNAGGYKAIIRNVEMTPPDGKYRVDSIDEVADYLGNIFIQPLLPHLGEYESLIISPDSALATVPLEAFRLNGKYLIEQCDVSYTYSSTLFYNSRQESKGNPWDGQSLLAIGAPDFDPAQTDSASELARWSTRGLGAWKKLAGAQKEINQVAALFPESKIFIGKTATKEKVYELSAKGALNKAGMVLFATHGYFDAREPQRSALILHGKDNGISMLTATEIAGMNFPSKLVVLSACETGRGKMVDGAGIVGLPYAFFRAGAENTIITLWSVDDTATADAVSKYFAGLKKGNSFSQSLTKVKRDFINSPDRSHPYYWAPLILYGH